VTHLSTLATEARIVGPVSKKYKVWTEYGDVVLETDDLQAAIAECERYAESDGAYLTDAQDKCI
jgi:hypothetical protein